MVKFKNNKTKIILGLLIFILGIIGYYIYMNQSNFSISDEDILISQDNTENVIDNETKNTTNEENKNMIIVHVSGAVKSEGIVELEEESRIVNAIEKAGGLKENACIKDINLASRVEDGEKIYIPTNEEYTKLENNNQNNHLIENSSQKSITNKTNKININTATQSELENLPGIGSATALKIITYRNENGKFKTIEDIKKVKGIGESKFKEIKDFIVI